MLPPSQKNAMPSAGLSTFGLSGGEVAARLETFGYNELPRRRAKHLGDFSIELLREPMVILLLGCGLIYLILGDKQEALMLLGFLAVILGITLLQERKAEQALAVLRNMASPRAIALRDGRKLRIAGREVVPDDVLYLSEGDRVPADGVLISATNLAVDESLLTGESMTITKVRGSSVEASMVYAGTIVVKGSAMMKVCATGPRTQLGKIGALLRDSPASSTRLEHETRQIVKTVAIYAACLCLAVALAGVWYRHNWTQGLLVGLTLAMAILPNELPAVLTIFLALGAWRIAKKRVLTRNLAAIEALGTTTVLCVDKTGTLTFNRMMLRKLIVGDAVFDLLHSERMLPEEFHRLLEYSLLASEPDGLDPLDQALKSAAYDLLSGTEHLHSEWRILRQYPLSSELLAISQAWQVSEGLPSPVAAKGAPEAIFDLCHMPEATRQHLSDVASMYAALGLRVLAVAHGVTAVDTLPLQQHDLDFEFLGLLGFEDPLRPEVPGAIADCYAAGIRVIMITGDHPDTARSIGEQAGLHAPHELLTGSDLATLDERELMERIRKVSVCARISPEQKARLVEALKISGEIVAMTGDGVNDAPALKRAHIGIAMGQRGADVAREAADLVLLDDDFGSIVTAVKIGRRIFANLQRAMSYLMAVHIPIAGLSVIPVFLNFPQILMPIHIAFLHLIIEPACSIAFEAEPSHGDLMRVPPRPPEARLFSKGVIWPTVMQGLSVLVILLAVFIVAWRFGDGEAEARSLAFTVLVIANLGLIIASLNGDGVDGVRSWRSRQKNLALRWVIVGALSLLLVVLLIPQLRSLFHFSKLHLIDLLLCLLAGLISSLWFTILRSLGFAKKY